MQEGGSENKRVKEMDVMDSSDGGRTRKKREGDISPALPLLLNIRRVSHDSIFTDSNGEMYLKNHPVPARSDVHGGACPRSHVVNNRAVFCDPSLCPLNLTGTQLLLNY